MKIELNLGAWSEVDADDLVTALMRTRSGMRGDINRIKTQMAVYGPDRRSSLVGEEEKLQKQVRLISRAIDELKEVLNK